MIELTIAFGAGLISFLSPCVLPLIPGYISYISGSSLNELIEKKNIDLFPIILFTIGFSLVFIILGAASTFLGQVLLQNSHELRIIAGLIIVIFSLIYFKCIFPASQTDILTPSQNTSDTTCPISKDVLPRIGFNLAPQCGNTDP